MLDNYPAKLHVSKNEILYFRNLPARLNVSQAALILGFSEHDIPILAANGLLKPLGKPSRNGPKYYSASDLLEKSRDYNWLSKATQATSYHWRNKNKRRKDKL